MRLDGKADKGIAQLWEVVSKSRLLVVPATLAVARSLCLSAIDTLMAVRVCSYSHMHSEVTPVDLLHNGNTDRERVISRTIIHRLVAVEYAVARLQLFHIGGVEKVHTQASSIAH